MSTARTKQRSPSGQSLRVATGALETWGIPAAAAALALVAATATALDLVAAPLAFAHHLPTTPVLAGLALAVLAAVVAVDTRLVTGSDGILTCATPAAFGAALALWSSNTVHPTGSSLIGATIFGGPLGLGLGALVWAIARRTLVDDRR